MLSGAMNALSADLSDGFGKTWCLEDDHDEHEWIYTKIAQRVVDESDNSPLEIDICISMTDLNTNKRRS